MALPGSSLSASSFPSHQNLARKWIVYPVFSAATWPAHNFHMQQQAAYSWRLVYSHVKALQEQYAKELEAETELQNQCEAACATQQV